MFKNLRLGMKIGIGFGVLILMVCFLGGLAIVKMKGVQAESQKLSQMLSEEYIPEVKIANNIERSSLATMYAMRGYAFTENESYLQGLSI